MSGYEGIVLFGGLYAGQMSGLKWLKKQLPPVCWHSRGTHYTQEGGKCQLFVLFVFYGLRAHWTTGSRYSRLLPSKDLIAAVAVGCAPMETPDLPESMEKLFGGTPEISYGKRNQHISFETCWFLCFYLARGILPLRPPGPLA